MNREDMQHIRIVAAEGAASRRGVAVKVWLILGVALLIAGIGCLMGL